MIDLAPLAYCAIVLGLVLLLLGRFAFLRRVAAYIFVPAIVVGVIVFMGGWEGLKSATVPAIYFGAGALLVHALIIDPIVKEIKALQHKLDYDIGRLRDRVDAISAGLNADRQERRDIRMRDHIQ